MKLALPAMVARGSGHVVNVASAAAKIGVPREAVYAATKHAVLGLSESVRAELRGTGVDLSVVMPGLVATELAAGTLQGRARARRRSDVAQRDRRRDRAPALRRLRPARLRRHVGAQRRSSPAAPARRCCARPAPSARPRHHARAARRLRAAHRARRHAVGSRHRRSRAGPRFLHGTGVERRPPVADGRRRGVRSGRRGPRAARDGRLHARPRRRVPRRARARAPGAPRGGRPAARGALRVLAEPHADAPRRGRARDRLARAARSGCSSATGGDCVERGYLLVPRGGAARDRRRPRGRATPPRRPRPRSPSASATPTCSRSPCTSRGNALVAQGRVGEGLRAARRGDGRGRRRRALADRHRARVLQRDRRLPGRSTRCAARRSGPPR